MAGGNSLSYNEIQNRRLEAFIKLCQMAANYNPFDNPSPEFIPAQFMADVNLYNPTSLNDYLKIMLTFVVEFYGRHKGEDRWEKIMKPINLAKTKYQLFEKAKIEMSEEQEKQLKSSWALVRLTEIVADVQMERKTIEELDFDEIGKLFRDSHQHNAYRQFFPITLYLYIIFRSANLFKVMKFLIFMLTYNLNHNKEQLDPAEGSSGQPTNGEYFLYFEMTINDIILNYSETLMDYSVGTRELRMLDQEKGLKDFSEAKGEILFSYFEGFDFGEILKMPHVIDIYDDADRMGQIIKRTVLKGSTLISENRPVLESLNSKIRFVENIENLYQDDAYRSRFYASYVYLYAGKFHDNLRKSYLCFKEAHMKFEDFKDFNLTDPKRSQFRDVDMIFKIIWVNDEALAEMWKIKEIEWKNNKSKETEKKLKAAVNRRINASTDIMEFIKVFNINRLVLWPILYDVGKALYKHCEGKQIDGMSYISAMINILFDFPNGLEDFFRRTGISVENNPQNKKKFLNMIRKHFDED